ncbi:FAD-binding oxidoreductase [Streptomyces fungicidicus]|uniref:FAD-dependent oxidoreductase n=1 Tax=Streptomyces fungicidicus TaxID=68203 RepID=A0ACC7XTD3_9ACTN|nr:FAD-dependent oxidoreductase [Streptomyces fungicidicus]NUV72786.1 FAD-dependent oxidoreductase [Streptomyces fungicidicus]
MNGETIVVGGGVIGLTSAVVLAEAGHRVRLWSPGEPGATTSAVAGGLWWPYRIEPEERVGAWALRSLEVCAGLLDRPEETGARLVSGVHAATPLDGLGAWAAEVDGLRAATEAEYTPGDGLWARLPVLDMPTHLTWLLGRLEAAGGRVERRTVTSLAEAAEGARAVVNCTGLGAARLVPDAGMRPVRGQLVVVENPGVDTWFTHTGTGSESTYFIPQPGRLLLGGTAEAGADSLEPDPVMAREIVARCARLRPEIAGARVLGHRVGLRPERAGGVRLEREELPGGGVLVHNYGHGGAGVTVAWGCADEVAALLDA